MFELNSRDFKKMKIFQGKISKKSLLKLYKCLIFKDFCILAINQQDKYTTFYRLKQTFYNNICKKF